MKDPLRNLINTVFFVALLIAPSTAPAFALDGIDSDENTDLPLNAKGIPVATLMATAGDPKSGIFKLEHGMIVQGVGNDADTTCDAAGLVRYNATSGALQYCNGLTKKWNAAAGGSCDKPCPAASFVTSGSASYFGQPLQRRVSVPAGECGEEYHPSATETIQCINGTWKYNAGGSAGWYNSHGSLTEPNNIH